MVFAKVLTKPRLRPDRLAALFPRHAICLSARPQLSLLTDTHPRRISLGLCPSLCPSEEVDDARPQSTGPQRPAALNGGRFGQTSHTHRLPIACHLAGPSKTFGIASRAVLSATGKRIHRRDGSCFGTHGRLRRSPTASVHSAGSNKTQLKTSLRAQLNTPAIHAVPLPRY